MLIVENRPFYDLTGLDSIRKGALAKIIWEWFSHAEVVFSVHEFGVWPSGEIPELFQRIRESQGFHQTLFECPGEIVGADEGGYLLCLVASCLSNCWDFSLIPLDRSFSIYVSHDDAIWINSDDPLKKAELQEYLDGFGLKRVDK